MRPGLIGMLVLALSTGARGQSAGLHQAAWMAGCWEMRGPGRTTLEMWMPPTADLMLGASRTVVNGVVRESEQLRLRAVGDTLVYTALPSGQQETDFRSTRVGADTIVFENPAHDFPQRIIYRRSGSDSLIARVEGPGPNNTTRGFSVPMRRVDCTQPIAAPIAPPPDTVVIDAVGSPSASTADANRVLRNPRFTRSRGGAAGQTELTMRNRWRGSTTMLPRRRSE